MNIETRSRYLKPNSYKSRKWYVVPFQGWWWAKREAVVVGKSMWAPGQSCGSWIVELQQNLSPRSHQARWPPLGTQHAPSAVHLTGLKDTCGLPLPSYATSSELNQVLCFYPLTTPGQGSSQSARMKSPSLFWGQDFLNIIHSLFESFCSRSASSLSNFWQAFLSKYLQIEYFAISYYVK